MKNKTIGYVILIIISITLIYFINKAEPGIVDYNDCVAFGNTVIEGVPNQCITESGDVFLDTNKELPEDEDKEDSSLNKLKDGEETEIDIYELSLTKEEISFMVEELQYCESDLDCVPKPGCHAMVCINNNYTSLFKVNNICTTEYRFNAAYNEDDCGCQNNVCVNLNKDYLEIE